VPKYVVQFAEPTGRMGRKTIEAATERAAVAQIDSRGFTPISIKPAAGSRTAVRSRSATKNPLKAFRGGRRRRAILDFTHQLAAVTESGIPIISGLKAVAEQTQNRELRAAIKRIVGRIEGGRSLADALEAEPEWFSNLFTRTVAAGEAAGKVPEVLLSLARYQEQEEETRGQIKSALLYPSLVVVVLVLATLFMLVIVVPQFARIFDRFSGELPLPTRILLGISAAITRHYIWTLLGVVAVWFALSTVFQYPRPRAWLDRRWLRLPVFGDILLGVHMVRFVELLDLLTQAALPITQSLRVTAETMTNSALRSDVRGMIRSVEGGRSLTEACAETTWLTVLVKRMLAIGEYAGRTDQVFAYLRKHYSIHTQRSIKMLSTLIEPALITGLAAIVLFFALAIFLPMWRVLKLVGST